MNGYYKAELVRGPARGGPWKTIEDLELATLGWVHWHNTSRLHGYLGDVPPAEFEAAFYATNPHRSGPGRYPIARASTRPREIQFGEQRWRPGLGVTIVGPVIEAKQAAESIVLHPQRLQLSEEVVV